MVINHLLTGMILQVVQVRWFTLVANGKTGKQRVEMLFGMANKTPGGEIQQVEVVGEG